MSESRVVVVSVVVTMIYLALNLVVAKALFE